MQSSTEHGITMWSAHLPSEYIIIFFHMTPRLKNSFIYLEVVIQILPDLYYCHSLYKYITSLKN